MKMFISLKYCYSKDHYKIDDKIGNNLIQRTQFSSSSFSFFLCVQLCMRACAYHAYIIYDDISYIHLKKKVKKLIIKKKMRGEVLGCQVISTSLFKCFCNYFGVHMQHKVPLYIIHYTGSFFFLINIYIYYCQSLFFNLNMRLVRCRLNQPTYVNLLQKHHLEVGSYGSVRTNDERE